MAKQKKLAKPEALMLGDRLAALDAAIARVMLLSDHVDELIQKITKNGIEIGIAGGPPLISLRPGRDQSDARVQH